MAPDTRERRHIGLHLVGIREVAKPAIAEIRTVGQPRIVDPIEVKVAAVPGDGVAAVPGLGPTVGGGALPASRSLCQHVRRVYTWLRCVGSSPTVGGFAGVAGIACASEP